MIAWVSPGRIVSVTPLRIALGPSSVSTLTWRSRISRVLMWLLSSSWYVVPRSGGRVVEGVLDVDQQVVAVHPDGVDRHRLEGRQGRGLAGPQVEGRPVQPALDRAAVGAALHVTLGQRDGGVGALVVDRVEVVAVPDQCQVDTGQRHGVRLGGGHVGDRTRADEAHTTTSDVTFFASSASTAPMSRSS